MNYSSEKISEKNLIQLVWLFNQEHVSKFSLDYFKCKFNTDWTRKKYIGFFAKDADNQVAAFYGGFPCQLKINDQIKLVLQSGDTITHANHRKKGLFVRLAMETYDYAIIEDFDYVFGFPNKNSEYGFFQKLGWKKLGNFKNFTFKYSNFNWFGLCHKFFFLKPFYDIFWNKQLAKYTISLEEALENYNQNYNGVVKDFNFFSYKLQYSNSALVKIENKIFWIKKDNGIHLGELFLSNEEVEFNNYLKPLAKAFKVSQVHFSCSENHSYYNLLMNSECIKNNGNIIGIRGLKNKEIPMDLSFVSGDSDDF